MPRNNPTVQEYRSLASAYKQDRGREPCEMGEVIDWAVEHQRKLPDIDLKRIHAERLAKALQSDTEKDEEGRTVRRWHCWETKVKDADGRMRQKHLWAELDDDPPRGFLENSLKQRLRGAIRDLRAVKNDTDNINKVLRRRRAKPIQLKFDFGSLPEEDQV